MRKYGTSVFVWQFQYCPKWPDLPRHMKILQGSFELYSIDIFLYLDLEMFLLTRNLFKVDLKEMRFAQI